MRKSSFVVVAALAGGLTAAGCGGDGGGDRKVTPRRIAGGGITDGPIAGWLNVYVVDEDTDVPLVGAIVQVSVAPGSDGCSGTTDSTGLAIFDPMTCPGVKGKQTVTATAAGYAPATWIGATGANLSMPLAAKSPAAVDTAMVSGTITGWNDLPAPAAGHQTLAIIGYSHTTDFGGRENEIMQGTRTALLGILPVQIPANVCVRNVLGSDCNFQLRARTGKQAHFAVILDQDAMGTPDDDTDDVIIVLGYALARGLTLSAGQTIIDEMLTRIPDTDVNTTTVTISGVPPGLEDVAFLPAIDLGAEGRIIVPVPGVASATGGMARVPKTVGVLAGARFDIIALAQDGPNDDRPASLLWKRGLDATTAISLNGFLAPPAALAAIAGTYSFTASAGANVHGADIEGDSQQSLWSVTIFDGSTSFTLPTPNPDPLPAGMLHLKVAALDLPGIELGDLRLDDAIDKLARLAEDEIVFTR